MNWRLVCVPTMDVRVNLISSCPKRSLDHAPGDRQSRKAKVNLIRFADDFVITGSSKEVLEHEVKPLVEQFMKERGLTLSAEKTLITHIEDGFDFLGQHVRKYNGKLIIKPSKKNVKAFLEKVRKVV